MSAKAAAKKIKYGLPDWADNISVATWVLSPNSAKKIVVNDEIKILINDESFESLIISFDLGSDFTIINFREPQIQYC